MKIKILIDPSAGSNAETAVGTVHDAIFNHPGNYIAIFGLTGTMWNLYAGQYEMASTPDKAVKNNTTVGAKTLRDIVGGKPAEISVKWHE